MNKPVLGMLCGGILGLFDGLSAWAYPDARPMMAAIVTGSVVKGVLTGLTTGLVARWWRSMVLGVCVGALVGAGLSHLAASGQPDHYWAIVLPGMVLGTIVGYATQRYGSPRSAAMPPASALAFAIVLASGGALSAQAPAAANDLSSLSFFLGHWEGVAEGQPGTGTATREYTAELRSKVIYAKHASEAIESIPKGYRSRETHVRLGPGEFEEVFELAEPGKDFEVYSRTRFKRVR